ncbi:malto-oligosyltrehalose synthase [Microbacterium sp. bgisy189]|uniref:malto-oligosyltrehalose synthase n=1 Tax=Microbacterium sp. bgisy189 TaxID=3413798 RepID=UPI003EB6CE43
MTPTSTYRLQIRSSFDLDAAADVADYLRDLGVGWAYLSPLLEATPGSDHGYDVVDASRIDPARGGAAGLDRFAASSRTAGLGILVDIVPNHQGVADPSRNAWWWDVLTRGRQSAHAQAFDIDWDFGGGRVVLPILGGTLDDVLAAGELTVDPVPTDAAPFGLVRYYDNVLPLAEGTAPVVETSSAEAVRTVLERQHWRLEFWQREGETLNYRRFFTITTLAGVRVEVPEVFAATHVEILRWFREGLVDGLRIDHPDGLADPGGYFADLDRALREAGATDPYVVVEKILEHGETLPGWWAVDGTTGYDAMADIDRVLTDPEGETALADLDTALRGEPGAAYDDLVHDLKRAVADEALRPEVLRIQRLLPAYLRDEPDTVDALAELLANFPVYRAYLPAGADLLVAAARECANRRPDLGPAAMALAIALQDGSSELSRRFMQTAGPVMAKGVEDAAFYRYTRLGSLTEVGADPSHFSLDVDGFHRAQQERQAAWPRTMTALSTHDTKRSEDVRSRLAVLSELADEWAETLGELRAVASTGHGPFDALLWQAIVGAWPASAERLREYGVKAAREAGERTSWSAPDADFEGAVESVVDAAFGAAGPIVDRFARRITGFGRSNSLSAKLLQLAGPGVPDVYQGSELWDLSLVDPDNRRAVDFGIRRELLRRIDEGWQPPIDDTGAAKLLVVSRTLRARRDRPDLFARYTPMTVVGEHAHRAVAFDRGGALAVATRLPAGLDLAGGWGDTALLRHETPTVDAFTGRRFDAGTVPLADLLADYPVALLLPAD